MYRFNSILIVLVILVFSCPLWGQQPTDSVVLLKDGQVYRGKVTSLESKLRIEFKSGAAIMIKTNEIELYCQTLEEAFKHLEMNSSLFDSSQQIRLIQWCIKNELPNEARQVIARMKKFGLGTNELEQLERDVTRLEDRIKSRIAAAKTIKDLPATESPEKTRPSISTIELEKFIKQLPEGSYANFSNKVQSRLIYNCSATKCHDYRDSTLRISYYEKGRAVPKRMTQRNLFEVMQWIDTDSPLESRLLKAAVSAHGGSSSAPWVEDSKHMKELTKWVFEVAGKPVAHDTTTVANLPGETQPKIDPDAFQPRIGEFRGQMDLPPSPINPLEKSEFKPIDPYDPEKFNRESDQSKTKRN